jgi:uncharacterized protein YcbK (DUF882 family)
VADVAKHFSAAEFRCKDGCGYGQPHRRLMACLERLRGMIGDKPIVIVSGLRCPPRNREVGGSPRSRHQSGEAADIPAGLVKPEQAERAGFTGIGISNGWVTHVDIREAKAPVRWHYQ